MIFIGEVVNTHGIKGELRILSDFKFKDIIFKVGNNLYIGENLEKLKIKTYRKHKNYDMVTFEGIKDITDALPYKAEKVFINRDDFKFPGVLDEDIIGLDAYADNKKIGTVENILKTEAHGILVIKDTENKHLIPYVDEFVQNIDMLNKRINIKIIEGLLDEN